MKKNNTINLLRKLRDKQVTCVDQYYDILEKCNIIKSDYFNYLSTRPVDCDKELLKLHSADYDTCCALLTMLLREDHFDNGSFERRLSNGQVKLILDKIIHLLNCDNKPAIMEFSEKALQKLNGYYVYALIDPRTDEVFYVGKGINNRVFSHEAESTKLEKSEKAKLLKIREIEREGYNVTRLIVSYSLTEAEAFAVEAALINFLSYCNKDVLTNLVAGHHNHECLTVEDFELLYGAESLSEEDIKHSIMVIKINKLYHRDMTSQEVYDTVRGLWRASINTINKKQVRYVFGVYNQLIVAVYKPTRWYYVHEMVDVPRAEELVDKDNFERLKNRVYFVCDDYKNMDKEAQYYLHKSVEKLTIQSAQNPITYLTPKEKNN